MESNCLTYNCPASGRAIPIHVNEESAKEIRTFLDAHWPVDVSVAQHGGALALMGWLTTRETPSGPFGGSINACEAAELTGKFAAAQGWTGEPVIPAWKAPDEDPPVKKAPKPVTTTVTVHESSSGAKGRVTHGAPAPRPVKKPKAKK